MFSLDANVLVYAFDLEAGSRHEQARNLLARSRFGDCVLALQVIGEFFVASQRRARGSRATLAAHARDLLQAFPNLAPSSGAVAYALNQAAAEKLQYWDALLLATLREAGCAVLLSEDMQHGTDYDGVRVVNPFLGKTLPDEVQALLEAG